MFFAAAMSSVIIAPPGGVPADSRVQERESEGERQRRLIEKGIVEPPPPAPLPPSAAEAGAAGVAKPSAIQEALSNIARESVSEDGEIKPATLKSEIDFGSWWPLVAPRKTTFVPDFSYGANVYGLTEAPEEWEIGRDARLFGGMGFVAHNAGAYLETADAWGTFSRVYAETNSLEVGFVGGVFSEESMTNPLHSFSWDVRMGIYPLKLVNAVRYTNTPVERMSEVSTHTSLQYTSVGVAAGAYWGFGGVLSAGPFVSVQTLDPWQVRARAGFRIALIGR